MQKEKVKKLAEALIKQYAPSNTIFRFDNAKSRLGVCKNRKSYFIIALSEAFIEQMTEEEVKNTILHEIAHALTPYQNHNKIWKTIALAIGCDGEVAFKRHIEVKKKYRTICPVCKKITYKHRKYDIACGDCCDKFNNGKYDAKYKLVFSKN